MVELCPCHRDLYHPPTVLDLPPSSCHRDSDHSRRPPTHLLCRLCHVIRPAPLLNNLGTCGGLPVFLRLIFLLCTVFYSVCIPSAMAASTIHEISWSPYTLLELPKLRVREDDKIRFICPSANDELALFWSRKSTKFERCEGEHSLFACNTSDSFEVQVTEFQWLPGLPSFNKDEPVYFVGRKNMCKYKGMRLIAIYTEEPISPKKTTVSEWGDPKTTALARGSHTKAEYFTLPHRPKTSANVQRNGRPSTTKLPKSATVKKSVPMQNTGSHSFAHRLAGHWLIVIAGALLTLAHHLILR